MRAAILATILCLAGCDGAMVATGSDADVSWFLTINNTAASGSGGMVVVVSYSDGSSRGVTVPAGGSVTVPASGASVLVSGGGGSQRIGPDSSGHATLILPYVSGSG